LLTVESIGLGKAIKRSNKKIAFVYLDHNERNNENYKLGINSCRAISRNP
jgi:hypothetical protein